MIVRKAESLEGNERIEHRRKNSGQAVGTFEPFEHPFLSLAQSPLAEWVDAHLREKLRKLVQPIQPKKEIAPGQPFRIGRQRQVAFMNSLRVQLIQVDAVLERARRFEVID